MTVACKRATHPEVLIKRARSNLVHVLPLVHVTGEYGVLAVPGDLRREVTHLCLALLRFASPIKTS